MLRLQRKHLLKDFTGGFTSGFLETYKEDREGSKVVLWKNVMSAWKDARSVLNMMKNKNTIVKSQTLKIQNRIEGDWQMDTISDIFDFSYRN